MGWVGLAGMAGLRLEVADFAGPGRWRWLLSEEVSGAPLADYEVDLAGEPGEFPAFTDLYRFVRWNAVPDRRAASEALIVARAGAWAGEAVLGRAVGDAIAGAAPVSVRVVVPAAAGFLLSWPLELAHAGGVPLAARGDVTLFYDLAPGLPGAGLPGAGRPAGLAGAAGGTGGALRVLGVFSLPSGAGVLGLRRERFELVRLVRRIAGRQGRRVQLGIVQYGASSDRLRAVAEAGDGWDVLHLSGHGGRGMFLLERPDGSPDPVDTGDLVGLLAPLRRRVQVAVVSACESAAATQAETLRCVGLAGQAEVLEQQAGAEAAGPVVTGLAAALAGALGCAVVAMRYPVADEFAIGFAAQLYERLLGVRDALPGSRGEPLGPAVARAVAAAAGPSGSALSLGTPVLVGAGKTACALELAYRHQDSFAAAAFWQALETPDEFGGALAGFAAALDIQLGRFGFAMSDNIATAESVWSVPAFLDTGLGCQLTELPIS